MDDSSSENEEKEISKAIEEVLEKNDNDIFLELKNKENSKIEDTRKIFNFDDDRSLIVILAYLKIFNFNIEICC